MGIQDRRQRRIPSVFYRCGYACGFLRTDVIDNASQTPDEKPMFDIPSIREYFIDLDHVLEVISDGPAKSIAYRRLKYLASKFEMYSLLNESKELAAMKVGKCYLQVVPCLFPAF